MKKNLFQLIAFLLFALSINGFIVNTTLGQETESSKFSFELEDKIPVDSKITIGKLENGLTYYIRENKKPENRAELRLVVKVGSVQEDDDQLGLAHFAEHMAFNGTKNFEKHALIDYLESIGMKFGPEINAYTSFERTVYMLQVPTDVISTLDTAFQILEDWGQNVSFEDEEIDKERGVVIEEWRLGRGASQRMFKEQLPVLFKDSRYADRYVIGEKEILETFSYETIRRFYMDWYRPELMAVVAVGDFDKNQIEEMIKEHFSRLTNPAQPREYVKYPVPDHEETLFAIASDKEAPMSSVIIYNKSKAEPEIYVKDLRNATIERLFSNMLSQRLSELTQKPDAPFAFGIASKSGFFGGTEVFNLVGYAVKDNKMEQCLDVLLTEYEKVRKYGFTETELERQKTSTLSSYEKMKNEADKTESRRLADEYIRNYLTDEFIPGIEYEYEFNKKYLPGITLDEVNNFASTLMTEKNRVVTVSMPDKEGLHIPTDDELNNVIILAGTKEIIAYEDKVLDIPLLAEEPKGTSVIEEKYIEEIDVTEWKLGNGVRVVLKPTEFKNDEIMFSSFSLGGSSLVSDENYFSASNASPIIRNSGLGKFNNIELQKHLAGKIVSVRPMIGDLTEKLAGNSSLKDMETMFQLIYLYFTEPRKDNDGYLAFKAQMQAFLENQKASPEKAFQDTVQVTTYDYNVRRRPFSSELFDEINLDSAYAIYLDRFSDASDFTFFFVGSFDLNQIKPLIEKYLGGLPSTGRIENWKDIGADFPEGIIEKTLYKGIEQKSFVQLIFTGPFDWTYENRWAIKSMQQVVDIKLREVVREEKGGTYGVRVWAAPERDPKKRYSFVIWFGCDPERVEELTETVFVQLDSLKNYGPYQKNIDKVKEIQKRTQEVQLKQNRFWLNSLYTSYFYGDDPILILEKDEMAEKLTQELVQKAAQEYLNNKNYIKVVLYPEKE